MTTEEQIDVTVTRRGSGLKYLHLLQEDLGKEVGRGTSTVCDQASSVEHWLAVVLYPSDADDEDTRGLHWTLSKWTYPDGRWRYHLEIRIDSGEIIEIKSVKGV